MPRRKPSDVNTIRYELGTWERSNLAPVLHAQSLEKYAEVLALLLDWKKLYLLITLVEMATGLEILWGTPNDLGGIVEQVRTWWQANKERYGEGRGLWDYLGLGTTPQTPEEIARIQSQAAVWANAFGVTVEGTPYTDPDAPTSTADLWAQAFGVTLP